MAASTAKGAEVGTRASLRKKDLQQLALRILGGKEKNEGDKESLDAGDHEKQEKR